METKKLGFGLMRLPVLDPKSAASVDIEQLKQMVDLFMSKGFTYFDTAIMYNGFASQRAAKEALVDRYPRDSFTLATKLHNGFFNSLEDRDKVFNEQLEQTSAGYFDYYLIHGIEAGSWPKYEKYDCFNWLLEKKKQGLVRHAGFSFHDTPELLDTILTKYPEMEFVQLQINYLDWDSSRIQSRRCYEVARKHGKDIIVMEPVKGGKLADPPEEVKKLFKSYAPDRSYASWAIRFVASLDGILTVLSGMSTIGQMKDNLSYMGKFEPFNEEEWAIISKAMKIMGEVNDIPCTACGYCTGGCPQQIAIPDIFKAANLQLGSGRLAEAKAAYAAAAPEGRRASDCIGCGQCESVCPQGIPVIKELKRVAEMFE